MPTHPIRQYDPFGVSVPRRAVFSINIKLLLAAKMRLKKLGVPIA